MTAADERRAQAAAQEALNRIADDVIAGRIDGSAPREVPAQPEAYAPDPYAPVEHYPPEHYAPQPANPYAQPYTHEQAAADAYAAQVAASLAQPQYVPPSAPYVAPPAPYAAPYVQPAPEVQAEPQVNIAPQAADTPATVVVEKSSRPGVLTYFTVLVAALSLCLSLYQGYLFHRSIELMEKNVARGEFIRTCRDVIGTYFDIKQKVGVLMPAADRGNVAGASRVNESNRLDAQAAIAKFGGLGTYLANFQDVSTRVRYTELTKTLNGIMDVARTTPLTDIDRLFTPADKLFADMNNDCVSLSQKMRM